MSSSPPTPPPSKPDSRPSAGEEHWQGGGVLARGWLVKLVIAGTLLMTLGMLALLYIPWLTLQEPTASIVVTGDSSLDGAQVLFTGGPSGSVSATLDQNNQFSTPVDLQPGRYHLTVKLEDQMILDTDVTADRLRNAEIALPTLFSVTGDLGDDGADAVLTTQQGATIPPRQELDRQSNYSASWRVQSGTYHLTVVRNGITLYDKDNLAIIIHHPFTVDLTQPQHRGHD